MENFGMYVIFLIIIILGLAIAGFFVLKPGAPNEPPILTNVYLSTDVVRPGDEIVFTTSSRDSEEDPLELFICKDSNCLKEWCHSPEDSCSINIPEYESPGEKLYYAKVCDPEDCSPKVPGNFQVVACIESETRTCKDNHDCDGIQTCLDGNWGSCVSEENWCDQDCDGIKETCKLGECVSCGCMEGETNECTDMNGCLGVQICINGQWGNCQSTQNWCDQDCDGIKETCKLGECVSCGCIESETRTCKDNHDCDGIQTCLDGNWGSCVSEENWCDQDCDGLPETCQSGNCKTCPTGYIYYAYNNICLECRYLAYNLIEDVISQEAPYSEVELKLWVDVDDSFVSSYVEKIYPDHTSDHWQEIKDSWKNMGVPGSAFPNPLESWETEGFDILDAISGYICVCDPSKYCYCDEPMGLQPINNGCVDTLPGCGDEYKECPPDICYEEMEKEIEDALEALNVQKNQ